MNETFVIVFAGLGTIAIYSYLFGENGLYRFFEHLYIGVAAGFAPYFMIVNFLWPKAIAPLLGFDVLVGEPRTSMEKYLIGLALVTGLFFYARYISNRLRVLFLIALTVTLGASAGLAIKGIFSELIPQIQSSIKPIVANDLHTSLNNAVFMTGLALTLLYFVFTLGDDRNPLVKKARFTAKLFIIICFGAFFGSTVSARLAILIERIDFLKNQWFQAVLSLLY